MGYSPPTKVSLPRAVRLCLLGILSPAKLADEELADNQARQTSAGEPPRAFVVRRAFWLSLGLVLGSTAAGYLAGRSTALLCGAPSDAVITASQAVGAALLLWGTLFVRGWEIQSWDGTTLTERVNRWIYQFFYCAGTAVLVWSLASAP